MVLLWYRKIKMNLIDMVRAKMLICIFLGRFPATFDTCFCFLHCKLQSSLHFLLDTIEVLFPYSTTHDYLVLV